MVEKISKILGWAVLGLSAVISVLFFLLPSESPALQAAMDALDGSTGDVKIAGVNEAASNWGGFIMYAVEVMTIICAALFVLFELWGIISNGIDSPKSLIKPCIVIVVIAILVVVSWSIANGLAPQTIGIQKAGYSDPEMVYSDIKLAEAGLWMTYFAGGAAVLALIAGPVISIIRK